jgi:hypothetical protein
MFMLGFPLLLIPFAIYNIIAFLMPGVTWTGVISTVHMVSGADWVMSAGDMLIALAIILLCGEIIKSTRVGFRTVVDHVLSRSCSSACWSSFCWSNRLPPQPSFSCSW